MIMRMYKDGKEYITGELTKEGIKRWLNKGYTFNLNGINYDDAVWLSDIVSNAKGLMEHWDDAEDKDEWDGVLYQVGDKVIVEL